MVSGSGFAHGLSLGRSANSGIYRIDNGREQHQHRPEHNNKQSGNGRLSERHRSGLHGHCSRPGRHSCRSSECNYDRQHCRPNNHHESE